MNYERGMMNDIELELLCESEIVPEARLSGLKDEAEQLMKILVTSAKTANKNR
jgi:hypothetical protein